MFFYARAPDKADDGLLANIGRSKSLCSNRYGVLPTCSDHVSIGDWSSCTAFGWNSSWAAGDSMVEDAFQLAGLAPRILGACLLFASPEKNCTEK